MDNESKYLLSLLRYEMTGVNVLAPPEGISWEKVVGIAEKHAVLPIIYQSVAENEAVPQPLRRKVEQGAQKTAQQSYRLLFRGKYFLETLRNAGIPVVLLKGTATAAFYPVPELRKSGDIDILLLDLEKMQQATELLEKMGCSVMETQPSLHHICFSTKEGFEVELHTMLAEPFDSEKMNRYMEEKLEECRENVIHQEIMGVTLPVLGDGLHAYELLLHMLQHFLRSGFGLKLLCDWVNFWNRNVDIKERKRYLNLVEESGLKGFSDMITLCCCQYLGLHEENVEWMQLPSDYKPDSFLEEILEAEEFGKSSRDRMVVLRGSRLTDYVREFHHQMRLNFPRAGRIFLCWPVLWIATLVRFLLNNRRIRKTSSLNIIKKAGQRSKMMEQLALFQGTFGKNVEK